MTRNALLTQSLKAPPVASPGVWRMTMDLIGHAFGASAKRREDRR